jgi:hypothetical protein
MANGPGDNLVDTLKKTFVQPVKTVLDTIDKVIPDAVVPKSLRDKNTGVDNSPEHDAAVKKANEGLGITNNNPLPKTPKKYHSGTDYVPETGPATLKKGEAVLNTEDAKKFREAKMAKTWTKDAKDGLAGKDGKKPPKVISHMVHHRVEGGGHHIEHHHTHPEAHPVEHHFKKDDDEMLEHFAQHAGTPNPGEPEAEAGTPENYQPGASPNVALEAAASPAAMAPAAGAGAPPMAQGA